MPEVIFKTNSPAALERNAAWLEIAEQQRLAYVEFLDDIQAAFGDRAEDKGGIFIRDEEHAQKPHRVLLGNRYGIKGFTSGYNEQAPKGSGWRYDRDEVGWVPDKRTKVGKEHQKRIDDLNAMYDIQKHFRDIGISSIATGGGYMGRPGTSTDPDGTIYQMWSQEDFLEDVQEGIDRVAPDGIVWERVPLSAWYARLEAQES